MCEVTTQPHLTKRKAHQSDLTPDRLLNTLKDLLIGVDYKTIKNHCFPVKVMFNLLPISSGTA